MLRPRATRMMRIRFDSVSEIKGDGMARGGRRAGAGRKASGKVAMLVRVSPKVRGAIEREAQRSSRSDLKSKGTAWHGADGGRARDARRAARSRCWCG